MPNENGEGSNADTPTTELAVPTPTTANDADARAEQYANPSYQRTVELETRYYNGMSAEQRYEAETDFALQSAGATLQPGDRILDLACGIGGHADALREKTGCEIDAFDLSHNLIEQAQARQAVNRTQGDIRDAISFRVGDMGIIGDKIEKEVEADRKYKLITILGDSFIYLPTEDAIREAFRQYEQLLAPGGKLVMQFRDAPEYREHTPEMDALREELGVDVGSYVTKKNYGSKEIVGDDKQPEPYVAAGQPVKDFIADPQRGDGVFTYMVGGERKFTPEGVGHWTFGRVYVDPQGVEHDMETANITDYRSKEGGRAILLRLLAEVGFVDPKVDRAPLGQSVYEMIAISASKKEGRG